MRQPSALLLDEPATHLDPQTRARVLQQVGIVQRTHGERTTIHIAAGTVRTWDTRVRDHRGPVVLGLSQHDLELLPRGRGDLEGRVQRVATTGALRLVTVVERP